MLLNDTALSAREWHSRAVSTVKGTLRQIKVLGFLVCFVFLREEKRRVITKGLPLFLRPIKTISNRTTKRKGKNAKLCV